MQSASKPSETWTGEVIGFATLLLGAEPLPARSHIIEVAAPPVGYNPLGALLAVTAASFVVGLLARRRMEEAQKPTTRIREGLAGLGEQTAESLADLLQRARSELDRRVS